MKIEQHLRCGVATALVLVSLIAGCGTNADSPSASGSVSGSTSDSQRAGRWHDNLPAVMTASKDDGKPILVLFTGSDWCSPCKAFERDVAETPEFLAGAASRMHLCRIDVPMSPGIVSDEMLAANRQLVSKYEVSGYPTLLFLDSMGRPVHWYQGKRVTTELLGMAELIKARHEYLSILFDKAANGPEELAGQFLAEALKLVPSSSHSSHYADEFAKLKKWVPDVSVSEKRVADDSDSDRRAYMKRFFAMTDAERIEDMYEPVLARETKYPDFEFAFIRELVPALIREGRAKDAHTLMDTLVKDGLEFPEDSACGLWLQRLGEAAHAGDPQAAFETMRMAARNDVKFKDAFSKIETIRKPEEKLAVLQKLDGLEADPVNLQWMKIQSAFAQEACGKPEVARSLLKAVADGEVAGGEANRTFAQQQLERLGKARKLEGLAKPGNPKTSSNLLAFLLIGRPVHSKGQTNNFP